MGEQCMAYTLAEAARAVRRDKTTLFKAIRKGTISATRDAMTGAWTIEPAELHRVYPLAEPVIDGNAEFEAAALPRHGVAEVEIRELRARLGDAQETIADLRRRLDESEAARMQADTERRQTAERLTALLTDQRAASTPVRRWWIWGRRG
jgi:hypothetical protein